MIPQLPHQSTSAAAPSAPKANRASGAPGVSSRNASLQEQKLRHAATQFESLLISTLWKSMKESFSYDDDSSDPANSTFDDMSMQSMADAMSKAGGLGLGKLILKYLGPEIRNPPAAKGGHNP